MAGPHRRRKRKAWRTGTEWLIRELRARWGNSIVMVANWAKDITRACPYQDVLDGITVERNPTTLKQRIMMARQWWHGFHRHLVQVGRPGYIHQASATCPSMIAP